MLRPDLHECSALIPDPGRARHTKVLLGLHALRAAQRSVFRWLCSLLASFGRRLLLPSGMKTKWIPPGCFQLCFLGLLLALIRLGRLSVVLRIAS